MKCPFELPVKKKPYKDVLDCEWYEILNANCITFVSQLTESQAAYIVQTINCHEKLLEACDHAYSFMICVTNLDNEENLKWQENVTEELKQALEKAEQE